MNYFVYIFIFLYVLGFSQTTSDESLIVVHYDKEGKTELRQLIYRYNFINNIYTGREQIMAVVGRKNNKDYVRCDIGINTLYKDRYLITGIGNIIDLQEKKVIHDGTAKLVRCSNDSIIFYTNDAFKGKFYSYFNLKTNSYAEIKSLAFKLIYGQDVEFDRSSIPYKLYYYPQNKPKVLLMEDAGHENFSGKNNADGIPIYWIDDDSFLFPNVKMANLEGTVIKYTISTKTIKEIGPFKSSAQIPVFYKFVKGYAKNQVEFYFKDELYIINPVVETMLFSHYTEIDDSFSVEVHSKSTGRNVYYKAIDIGKKHFELINFKTSSNYAGIVKEIRMGDESYQQGIEVYNITKKKWESIDSEDVAALVGWIKK